jgi:hypothetical protein
MSNIAEQIARIEAIERRLSGGAIRAVTIAGADLCADIANRVINTGETSTGGRFSNYTPLYLRRVRLARGLSTTKNFFVKGEMWGGFRPKSVQYSAGIYVLTIGGFTKASADKIGWMSAQERRSIIAPNVAEKGRAAKTVLKFVING